MTSDINTVCESKDIEWKIQKIFELPNDLDYELHSDHFSVSDVNWYLLFYPNGQEENNCSGWIGLYLNLSDLYGSEVKVICRIGIRNANGTVFKAEKLECKFNNRNYERGFPKFIERSRLMNSKNEVVPDGTLIVFCNLQIIKRPFLSLAVDAASQTNFDGILRLTEDLKNLYLSSCHADVTIKVKDKEFRAHRSILSTRSSVFRSMFLHDMEEKSSGIVEITDCDADTFETFLLFLYTGKFESASCNNALGLYRSADKYDVQELKDECVHSMIEKLSDDVFCDVLLLATVQKEEDLLKAVTDYFRNNARTIILTTKWEIFLAENPITGNELFYKVLNAKDYIGK